MITLLFPGTNAKLAEVALSSSVGYVKLTMAPNETCDRWHTSLLTADEAEQLSESLTMAARELRRIHADRG